MKGKLFLWHRRLALIVFLPLLIFGLSGLLHPVMRLTAPEAAQHVYMQPQWPEQLPTFSSLSSKIPLHLSAGVKPVKLDHQWLIQHWQGRLEPTEFYSLNGELINESATAYAEQLARHFSGDQLSKVTSIKRITEFGHHYPAINRLLPVWEVRFDRPDQLGVFVDIRHDRLAAMANDSRRTFMKLFHLLHVWAFLDQEHPARTALFIAMMLASMVLGLTGIYLYVVLPIKKRKKGSLKKHHAVYGSLVSLALLMFVFSGLIRTIEKQTPEIRGLALNQIMDISQVRIGLEEIKKRYPKVTLAYPHLLEGEIVWQIIQPRQPDQWVNAVSGKRLDKGAESFAKTLVAELTGEQVRQGTSRLVYNFKMDQNYGFIDKRLPILAIDTETPSKTAETFYVDTRDSVLSVKVNDADQVYSWIFRYLHKWRFADGLGLIGRDGLISLFILGISAVSILGVIAWFRRIRKQKTSRSKATTTLENA